jgi:hypothetical protein
MGPAATDHRGQLRVDREEDLRHTAATGFAAGLELKVVQHRLGHSSIVTTARIYISVLRHHAQAAALAAAEFVLKCARLRLQLGGQPTPRACLLNHVGRGRGARS